MNATQKYEQQRRAEEYEQRRLAEERELRTQYCREGWGSIALEHGYDPVHTESSARRIFRSMWERQGIDALKPFADEAEAVPIETAVRMLSNIMHAHPGAEVYAITRRWRKDGPLSSEIGVLTQKGLLWWTDG